MPGTTERELGLGSQANFRRNIIWENISRGKYLSLTMIGFECILAGTVLLTSFFSSDTRFHFDGYFLMYLIMIAVNVLQLSFLKNISRKEDIPDASLKKYEVGIMVYLTLIMVWGACISLMDQALYGQLIVFMVIMVISSVIYVMDAKKMLLPYIVSTAVLMIGLPFFQPSSDILVGHYVNLSVFIVISWIASRIIFRSYQKNFNGTILLKKSNEMLAEEIQLNHEINKRLSLANLQLKNLALLDELTEIPNRRGFYNYLESIYGDSEMEGSSLSVIMLDIDFFKRFNDTYGHDAGDNVLRAVARQAAQIAEQQEDIFCRWGGEEFIYLTFGKSKEEVILIADEIKHSISCLEIPNQFSDTGNNLSVSLGAATICFNGNEDVSRAIQLADRALYKAKDSGRDCICYAE